jgi:hypothetical protein
VGGGECRAPGGLPGLPPKADMLVRVLTGHAEQMGDGKAVSRCPQGRRWGLEGGRGKNQ